MSMNKKYQTQMNTWNFKWFYLLIKCNHMNLFVSVETHSMK
jgi:hypothetical protein